MATYVVILVLLNLLLSALPTLECKEKCAPNWETLNESCILVSNVTASWEDANKTCSTIYRSKLITIEDENKNNQVVKFLYYTSNATESEFYIGLYKSGITSQFKWIDGTSYNYSNWPVLNPNAKVGNLSLELFSKNSTCVLYKYVSEDFKWVHHDCETERRFICQKDFNRSSPGKSPGINGSESEGAGPTKGINGSESEGAGPRKGVNGSERGTAGPTKGVNGSERGTAGPTKGINAGSENRTAGPTKGTLPTKETSYSTKTNTNKGNTGQMFTPTSSSNSAVDKAIKDLIGKPVNETKARQALNGVLNNLSNEIKSNMTSDAILNFVKEIEHLGKVLTDGMKKADGNITVPKAVQVENENLMIEVSVIPSNGNFTVKFPKENSGGNIILPDTVIGVAQKFENNSGGVGITSVFLPGLGKSKDVLISGVISTNVDVPSGRMQDLKDPVVISLPLGKKLEDDERPKCAFIDESTSNWSSEGCDVISFNSTFTVSHSSHLTSFAVLLDVHKIHTNIPEEHKFVLLIVSIVGCCIALICFVAALIAFCLIVSERRRRKTETISIHKNLAIAEIFALTFFLLANAVVDSEPVCFAMAVLLHYFLMAVFLWMLIEGLNLHRGLVQVFVTSSRMKFYKVFGWVTPLLFVISTAAVGGMDYVREDFCWISHDYIWVFAGPVAVILFINLIILCIAIRVMIKRPSYKVNKIDDSSKCSLEQEIRVAFKTTIILLPLLGLTWCLGFLSTHSTTGNIIVQYMFAVVNSLQGLYFFFAHCVYDEDVIKTTSNASIRMKSYFSRTLSNSGQSGSGSVTVSNSKRVNTYCNASFHDGRACKSPCNETCEMNGKKSSVASNDSSPSASRKASIIANGNYPCGTSVPYSFAKDDTKQNSSYPSFDVPLSTSAVGFDAFSGIELNSSSEEVQKTTTDTNNLGTSNQQLFE